MTVIMESNGGIKSLSASHISQINKLVSKKGADNKVLVAKFKGKEVKFSAVKAPKVSAKSKQSKPIKGAEEAANQLGIKDRKVVTLSDAKKYIADLKNSEMNKALGLELSFSSALSYSTSSLDSGMGSSISGSNESLNTLHSDFSTSSTSLHSSLSDSISSLDSLDAEGEPIFGTFQPKPLAAHSTHFDDLDSPPDYPAPAPPSKGKSAPPHLPPKTGTQPPRPQKNNLNAFVPPPLQKQESHGIEPDHVDIGLIMSGGKPEITFEPAGDLDLPPDYPAPPPPRPPKGKLGNQPPLPPRPVKSNSKTQLTSHRELASLTKKYGVNIRPIEINGSPVGYIFSNPRDQAEPKSTTLLVETHGGGYYAGGEKIPPFTTPANTRFLMSARRNQTFEVAPWMQADAISRGQIDFSHDDQIYGSLDQGSGTHMTNYHLSPITKKQGDTYDLSLEKTAQLMQFFKKSAVADGRINNFDMFMLDPNMTGHVSTKDLMTAFDRQGVQYKDIIMNVCRPQQKEKVSMTKAIDNIQRAKQNRLSQMGTHRT